MANTKGCTIILAPCRRRCVELAIGTLLLGVVACQQATGLRTISFETSEVSSPDIAVSPNGDFLIFTMLGKLFRVSSKGGAAEQLTFGPYYDNDPAISPDGNSV